jgi:hypothetical protein
MYDLLDYCVWPPLPAPYDQALHEAVQFILSRFRAIGIVAGGTILRGTPDTTSDLDIVVIHREPVRQRLQHRFNTVPAEIFVNPPVAIERSFVHEQASARPIMAHLLATGTVILALDATIGTLRDHARQLLQSPPARSPEQIIRARYTAATRYEDARDVVDRDPAVASLLLSQAVVDMLQYLFVQTQAFQPRAKELVEAVRAIDAETARLVDAFVSTATLDDRLLLGSQIAARTIGVDGFFAWESTPEPVVDGPDASGSLG